MTDTDSDPGSWADMIAHSPCMDVSDYVTAGTGQAIAEVEARQRSAAAIALTGQADD